MARLTGLFQRGNSYYLQVVLPQDHPLQTKYKNGKFVQSLGRCSYREALQTGTVLRAQILYGLAPRSATSLTPTEHTLRQIHNKWKSSKARSTDSVQACLRAVRLYENFTNDLPIEQVTREHGEAFRAWLIQPEQKTTSKTARDRLIWVKSLLHFAAQDLALIRQSPWNGIDIDFKTVNKRRPWSLDELAHLFNQPLHLAYELPAEAKAGKDAAYWIPLLGLFTGARLGEIAQLRVRDVQTDSPVPLLSITNEGETQRVKTKAGIREVPVHSQLIRLGFLDYARQVRSSNNESLWPDLATRVEKAGGYFSQWFGGYRRSLGFGSRPDFHCFRHTVRTQMAEAGVQEGVIDRLVGHEVKGSVGARVYTHRTPKSLSDAIEVLNYPLLLPVVYT